MVKLKISKTQLTEVSAVKPDVKVRLTFYLNGNEAEQLRVICEAEDISVSQKIRQHVKQLLHHHQK